MRPRQTGFTVGIVTYSALLRRDCLIGKIVLGLKYKRAVIVPALARQVKLLELLLEFCLGWTSH